MNTHNNINIENSCYKKKIVNSSGGDNMISIKLMWSTFFKECFSNGRFLLSNKWILDSSYSILTRVLSVMIIALRHCK